MFQVVIKIEKNVKTLYLNDLGKVGGVLECGQVFERYCCDRVKCNCSKVH